DHGCADCNQHRPQTHNSGIQQRIAQRLAALTRFFNEIEQHDDVADDHAYQTHTTEEGHKAERRSHYPQSSHRSYHPERYGREYDERFERVFELKNQRNEDREDRNQQDDRQVLESLDLILLFTADLHLVAGRQRLGKSVQLRARAAHPLRRQHAVLGESSNGNGAELIPAAQFFGLHTVFNRRNLAERHVRRPLRGIDVEIVDVGKLSALFHSQARDDWD